MNCDTYPGQEEDSAVLNAPKLKRLRSSADVKSTDTKPVLPNVCILCGKAERFIYSQGKNRRDKLTQASTLEAGKKVNSNTGLAID